MAEEDEVSTLDPQECFQQLFKMEKYRQRLAALALSDSTSLTVDFDDLIAHNMELAETLLNEPDEYLKYADNAAFSQLQGGSRLRREAVRHAV